MLGESGKVQKDRSRSPRPQRRRLMSQSEIAMILRNNGWRKSANISSHEPRLHIAPSDQLPREVKYNTAQERRVHSEGCESIEDVLGT